MTPGVFTIMTPGSRGQSRFSHIRGESPAVGPVGASMGLVSIALTVVVSYRFFLFLLGPLIAVAFLPWRGGAPGASRSR